MKEQSSRVVKDERVIKSDGCIIGKCPWCDASIIKSSTFSNSCICCESPIIWNIENINT